MIVCNGLSRPSEIICTAVWSSRITRAFNILPGRKRGSNIGYRTFIKVMTTATVVRGECHTSANLWSCEASVPIWLMIPGRSSLIPTKSPGFPRIHKLRENGTEGPLSRTVNRSSQDWKEQIRSDCRLVTTFPRAIEHQQKPQCTNRSRWRSDAIVGEPPQTSSSASQSKISHLSIVK